MEDAAKLQKPARLGVWLAPIIALVWLSAVLAGIALLLYCSALVKSAWLLL